MLGKAFAVLSDKDKRDSYEQYGADGPQLQQRGGGGGFHHHGGFYDDDGINPEEIFNMFFGGGIPTGSTALTDSCDSLVQDIECIADERTFGFITVVGVKIITK